MALKLYNTLTQQKDLFTPIDPQNVRMYVCGPTVYDEAHIGNGRPILVFDILFRILRHIYGKNHVTFVRNITDVDDKINARALERDISIGELTSETTRVFHENVHDLGCLMPNIEPRATAHIEEMIQMIQLLIVKGHAYEAEGHVLFSVPSMPDYGALSKRDIEDMRAGARVEVAPYKRSDTDFVLWKPSNAQEPGWESPWGFGRPGWHIECSAMSWKYLGEQFDIHGGGIDLVFPHHENEIAQSCCTFGHARMANIWMHNGFLQVEGEKMSKSLGNFITLQQILHGTQFGERPWVGEVVRLAMIKTHYRQPIDWTLSAMKEAQTTLDHWYGLIAQSGMSVTEALPHPAIWEALEDDLNTPLALSRLHELFNNHEAHELASLISAAQMMGLLQHPAARWREIKANTIDLNIAYVEGQIMLRQNARLEKNWAEADRIRQHLAQMNVQLEDIKDQKTGKLTTKWDVS